MNFPTATSSGDKSKLFDGEDSENEDIALQNLDVDRLAKPSIGRSQSLFDRLQETPRESRHLSHIQHHPSQRSHTNIFGSVLALTFPKSSRRSDRRLKQLNTQLLEAIKTRKVSEVERLLNIGASPNASCHVNLVSACHLAALAGGPNLSLLMKAGAEKLRVDRLGRTPLHFAAWAGNVAQIAVLLGFPEDLQERLDADCTSAETAEVIKEFCGEVDISITNNRCGIETKAELPSTWSDNIDHNCRVVENSLPYFQPGWTPLHAASACARHQCVALLLAAGSDPNIRDFIGRTPLDVVCAHYNGQTIDAKDFTETIKTILRSDKLAHPIFVQNTVLRRNLDTPLHTAVHLGSLEAIRELLDAGISHSNLNRAGDTALHVCVKKKLKEHLQLLVNYPYKDLHDLPVDVRDKDGYTVLHTAISHFWTPGVCVCLEAGADVTAKAHDEKSPIHTAAALGHENILSEVLSVAKIQKAIDFRNHNGETALFKAIISRLLENVKKLLQYGADIQITLPKNVNVFHVAAERGLYDILKVLLDHDYSVTRAMINFLTTEDRQGYGPIHFAVLSNSEACVKLLLSKNAYVNLKTSLSVSKYLTPLHMAAQTDNVDIARILLRFDENAIHNIDESGWSPLHVACHSGSRKVIILLLKKGDDLSSATYSTNNVYKTAIQMIMDRLAQPTEFMEEIFNSHIKNDAGHFEDPNYTIKVDYGLLMPTAGSVKNEQMRVIEALIETGNRYNQRKLLLHPYVESFLFLKWQTLLPFFYTIIALYGLFVVSFTIYVLSVYSCKDTNSCIPLWFDPHIWKYFVYVTATLIISQEIFLMNLGKRYFCQIETWVKAACLSLALSLPTVVITLPDNEWTRHMATIALLLAWFEMTVLLSRFPRWGFYVLMFGKVSTKVLKILLTFGFLLIGFSLSFMIQFHSESPFEGPLAAFIKTIVMMTSEFDYDGLIKGHKTALLITRLIFLIFLILAAIVLMNLMVGVAVNDLNNLEVLGNIRRLQKQVEFLRSLETLAYHKIFRKFAPKSIKRTLKYTKSMHNIIELKPNSAKKNSYYSKFPSHIRDAIISKVLLEIKQTDEKNTLQTFKRKLDSIHDDVVSIHRNMDRSELSSSKFTPTEGDHNIRGLDKAVMELRNEMAEHIRELRSPLEDINIKMSLILSRLDKLESEIK